jgi:hypothetical protein
MLARSDRIQLCESTPDRALRHGVARGLGMLPVKQSFFDAASPARGILCVAKASLGEFE